MSEDLHLFYVRADDDEEGNNQDLLVRAMSTEWVLIFWRGYYELKDDAMPTFIGRVPLDQPAGPIDWRLICPDTLPL